LLQSFSLWLPPWKVKKYAEELRKRERDKNLYWNPHSENFEEPLNIDILPPDM
jgi:hypothetical protein